MTVWQHWEAILKWRQYYNDNGVTTPGWQWDGNTGMMTAWWQLDDDMGKMATVGNYGITTTAWPWMYMFTIEWRQLDNSSIITTKSQCSDGGIAKMAERSQWHDIEGIITLGWKRWNDDDGGMTTAWWSMTGRQLWNDDSMITTEWRLHDENGMMMMAWRQHICVGAHICTYVHYCSSGMPRFALYTVLVFTTFGTSQSCKTAAASTWKAGAKGDESFA